MTRTYRTFGTAPRVDAHARQSLWRKRPLDAEHRPDAEHGKVGPDAEHGKVGPDAEHGKAGPDAEHGLG
eukprot:4186468-Alexandrium_andersonii.AAC.1